MRNETGAEEMRGAWLRFIRCFLDLLFQFAIRVVGWFLGITLSFLRLIVGVDQVFRPFEARDRGKIGMLSRMRFALFIGLRAFDEILGSPRGAEFGRD